MGNFFAQHHIGDANWAVSDKSEACSALQPGASGNGGWSQLTQSGSFVRGSIRGDGGGSPGGGCCRFGADCGDCGEDGTGWCHQSASNCATGTGIFDPTGTPPPGCGGSPTPGPPAPPPPPSTCSDGNPFCPDWAASGECQRNPGWMLENCRLSCGNCPTTPCTDNNAGCAAWAASGECEANPGWMLENCCQSC